MTCELLGYDIEKSLTIKNLHMDLSLDQLKVIKRLATNLNKTSKQEINDKPFVSHLQLLLEPKLYAETIKEYLSQKLLKNYQDFTISEEGGQEDFFLKLQ